MFDARYAAFATISALLVISPGATMAVVLEAAIGEGRRAALYTVVGVSIGNSSLALASALGLSFVFHQWPLALQFVRAAGAGYLAYLGLRGLWHGLRGGATPGAAERLRAGASTGPAGPSAGWASSAEGSAAAGPSITRGVLTNLLNPPVILFYMTFLPQFVGPQDPFFTRFVVLAVTHVSMSVVWLSIYAAAIGALAERMARPMVRRTLEGLTGLLLVGFGVRLLLR
jgi:threonine/homoserine/homoserine lactone efflux protein